MSKLAVGGGRLTLIVILQYFKMVVLGLGMLSEISRNVSLEGA